MMQFIDGTTVICVLLGGQTSIVQGFSSDIYSQRVTWCVSIKGVCLGGLGAVEDDWDEQRDGRHRKHGLHVALDADVAGRRRQQPPGQRGACH